MQLVERHTLIEEALDAWRAPLGGARAAYSGHVYRVFNFARFFHGAADGDDELALTSAFHDLGIWSDRTFDYLAPSIARASEYARAKGLPISIELIAEAIDNHHSLRSVRGGPRPCLVEAFRRADLADLSGGLLRSGLDSGFFREVVATFPRAGFHGCLLYTSPSPRD